MKWRSIFIFKLNKWMNSTYSSLVQSFNLKFSKSAARNVKNEENSRIFTKSVPLSPARVGAAILERVSVFSRTGVRFFCCCCCVCVCYFGIGFFLPPPPVPFCIVITRFFIRGRGNLMCRVSVREFVWPISAENYTGYGNAAFTIKNFIFVCRSFTWLWMIWSGWMWFSWFR